MPGTSRSRIRPGSSSGISNPYVLRHTAATWMAQDGVPLGEIAGYLGHADTRMVERRYAHHHPDFREQAKHSLNRRLARLEYDPERLRPKGKACGAAPVSPQFRPSPPEAPKRGRRKSLKKVVGAAGIEPATPTMST